MIKEYLRERFGWIVFFIVLQLLSLFIAYLDSTITIRPVLYTVLLSTISLIIFVSIRYYKETAYFKQLLKWDEDYDPDDLRQAASPFERIIENIIEAQTKKYQRDITKTQIMTERKQDELMAWIHEVKTPLTAIKLIIDRVKEEEIKQQLTYEWLRIHLLLDQQLHQIRIPTIETDLYIDKTYLEPLIIQEIKDVQSWCISKGIGINISLEVKEVLTDGKWLSFIIRQLLTNAIKHSMDNDISIISYYSENQKVLAVQDHGQGITTKDLPRIFDRGFTSTMSPYDAASSGMGLYLVDLVAKPLHIQIDVNSILGKGTIFTLTYPRNNDFLAITGM